MPEFVSESPGETEQIGSMLGKTLKAGDIVAIFGSMGSGKTVFVRGLASGMGIDEFVSSPTFAIVNEYRGHPPLYHFDMYRINSWNDLYSTGFFDLANSGGVIAVEWSENIENALPSDLVRVKITAGKNIEERRIVITGENRIDNSRS